MAPFPEFNPALRPRPTRNPGRPVRWRWVLVGLATLLLCGTTAWPAESVRIAVLPLVPARNSAEEDWFGAYVQTLLREALLRSNGAFVMPASTARRWQQKLRLYPHRPVSAKVLERLGVDLLVQGSSQTVLQLTRVRIQISDAKGDRTPKRGLTLQWRRGETPVRKVATGLAAKVLALLRRGPGPPLPPQPPTWGMARAFYSLPREPSSAGKEPAVRMLRVQYSQWTGTPGLAAKAHGALALQALSLTQRAGAASPAGQKALASALQHARRAEKLEPWNPGWTALKAEVHLFRKEYDLAKSFASMARLRNPLDGLPSLVLAMESGLSTGGGKRFMRLALAREPFLVREELPQPDRLYQGGVMEPVMASWRKARSAMGRASKAYLAVMTSALAEFEAKRWDDAEPLFVQAAGMDDSNHEPRLYLARILLEAGNTSAAVQKLRVLVAEYPQEPAVHYYLGMALAKTDLAREAAEAFARVLVEDPDDQNARFALALARMADRSWKQALKPLRTLLLRDPRHMAGWLHLGIVYTQLQLWEPAEGALRQTLNLDPQSAEAKDWLQKLNKRKREMERMESSPPDNPRASRQ